MKRRITLSIALVLSVVLVSLMSSDRAANAAPPRTFVADTGVIKLGPNQTLRMTVANGPDPASVQFRRLEYTVGTCEGGVCKWMISSQTMSDPTSLAPGEAVHFEDAIYAGDYNFRNVVTSNRQNVKVNALIINTMTGEVEAIIAILVGL